MPTALLRSQDFERYELPDWYLRELFPRIVFEEQLEGKHVELFQPPMLDGVAALVRRALSRVESL